MIGIAPQAVRDAAAQLGSPVRIGGLTPYEPDEDAPAGLERVTKRARTVLDEDGGLGVIILDKLGVSLEELRAELG
jgi:hypothetical protein